MSTDDFNCLFKALTGHSPFPWQERLYARWLRDGAPPHMCDIPTGLGKTSVIAVWLLVLAQRTDRTPRRLVYVVNRRTVVDQTTEEVQRYREGLTNLPDLSSVADTLRGMCAGNRNDDQPTLAISTLRGQFADNREWSADPSRPAVICGTVDMIGSRLLFEGYRIGFKSRPLHAGFLGQDALLVHDEAHLEPAFQQLVESIKRDQIERETTGDLPWPKFNVMALSATARSNGNGQEEEKSGPLELTDEEKQPASVIPEPPKKPIHHVWRRLNATKSLQLHPLADEKKLAEAIAQLALDHRETGRAVLVFARTVDVVNKVIVLLTNKKDGVAADHVRPLTGTMRGYERDKLVEGPTFRRFSPDPSQDTTEGTVYLVCTSAGEVGVNISADHLVCDLSTFDSMAQRFGRVNRFGDRSDTRVDVVHPETFDDKKPNPRREATLALLTRLNGDASPGALGELPADQRLAAFAPEPTILPATDILFDAWALTTIRDQMPGRPPVAPYLHGVAEWEPPRTAVAWRTEVGIVTGELIERSGDELPRALLDDYPLKGHELLVDRTDRVYAALEALIAKPKPTVKLKREERLQKIERARKNAAANVWLVDQHGAVTVTALGNLMGELKRRVMERLADATVLLSPAVGGLSSGLLLQDSKSGDATDVADKWRDETDRPRRKRQFGDEPRPPDGQKKEEMALIRTIDTDPMADETAPSDESEPLSNESDLEGTDDSEGTHDADGATSSSSGRYWHWYVRPRDSEDATRASTAPISWQHHTDDVVQRTTDIVTALNLPGDLRRALIVAAELHDLGKKREIWQRSIGNPKPSEWYAKSGKPSEGPRWRARHLSYYRHEFGSLLDVLATDGEHTAALAKLTPEMKDLALHLIAAHHGYARPHFPARTYDHERYDTEQNEQAAHEAMLRFARLQRRYGRWGLAYLESLLRAADWAASAAPTVGEGQA